MDRSNSQPDQIGILLTRVFRAPRSRVWKEWTEPAAFADWFGGTRAEIPVETVSMDVREGGQWRATMFVGPDRREIQWSGEYRDVVEPKLLVLTFCDRPDNDCELMTVALTEPEEGWTEMLIRQRGGMTPEEYERARSGLSSFLDRMAQRLETERDHARNTTAHWRHSCRFCRTGTPPRRPEPPIRTGGRCGIATGA